MKKSYALILILGLMLLSVASLNPVGILPKALAQASNPTPQTATLYAASANQAYRIQTTSSGGASLDLAFSDPSFDNPGNGIAFSPRGELFITNRGSLSDTQPNQGSISRFLLINENPVYSGSVTSSSFGRPHYEAFFGNELFIANPTSNNVLRFIVDNAGNITPNGSITTGFAGFTVRGIAVSPWGELFVSECCGIDTIFRFNFDGNGNAVPNGTITGAGLSNTHNITFSPWGELFAANLGNNSISRITFNAAHQASSNGLITANTIQSPIDVAFSPWGELFISNTSTPGISRFVFDSSHTAIQNGYINTPAVVSALAFEPPVQTSNFYAVAENGPDVFRYQTTSSGAANLDLTFTHSSFDNPGRGIAFSPSGEMFISSIGPTSAFLASNQGSISRFLTPSSTPIFNGIINSSSFGSPIWMTFKDNELFVVNGGNNDVERFIIDANGNAVYNGAITAGLGGLAPPAGTAGPRTRSVAFAPWGELFVSKCCGEDEIFRYLFDANGNAIPNGSIRDGSLISTHGIAFSPWGELFVTNPGSASIGRYKFDAVHNASFNGSITGSTISAPIDLAFSPWGELFISDYGAQRISRFSFDTSRNAIPHGSFNTPRRVIAIAFPYTRDTMPPQITCPTDLTVNKLADSCSAIVNYTAPTATDNSSFASVTCTPSSGAVLPIGSTVISCVATDASDNTANCSFTVTVVNHAPSTDAGGTYNVPEGGATTLAASGSDVDGDALSYAWDLDNNGSFETAGQSVTFSAAILDGPSSRVVRVRVTDSCGTSNVAQATVNVLNVAPVVGTINAPVIPNAVNMNISASANFSDAGVLDTHTAVWNWGDGSTSAGTVAEANGSGTVSGTHTYTAAGVYTLTLTVTDKDGATGQASFLYIVVYDPSAGFVTGGGWISSPAGAYAPDPALTGQANFGFVSRYQRGATVPTGNTQFIFHTAGMNFQSTSYEWLVISGARAQYKGSGRINGGGDYGFMLTAVDGQVNGGGGVDKFRIKIWDRNTGAVVYDNQMGGDDTADPTTVIAGGSVVIHAN